jgi:hypothetical protein
MPDSAYNISNLPLAKHMPLTTASKIVRASRVNAAKNKKQKVSPTKKMKNVKSKNHPTASK